MAIRDVANDDLRARAERALRAKTSGGITPEQVRDVRALLYELQVHDTELRMQNEELQQAQAELQDSRSRYRELFDHAPVAYLTLDARGYIEDANHMAAELLGTSRDLLRKQPLAAFVAERDSAVLERYRRTVLRSEQRQTCTLEIVPADGGPTREARLESIRLPPPAERWRCTIVDLSELNRLQRRVSDMEKADAVNALASGVAHEFNNALMAMLGAADMAVYELEPGARARAHIERVRDVALRARSIIEQVLRFARPSSDPARAVTELDAGVKTSEASLHQMLGDSLALELDLKAGNARVRGDVGQLEQILLNLASNARDATADGGTFRIETRLLDPDQLGADVRRRLGERPAVMLRAVDTGSGMDAATAARIFDPFFTTKPGGKGTGLGLAIVHDLVRQTGGEIEVQSQPGKGTSFRIWWPVMEHDRPSAATAPPAPADSAAAGSARVLLVEDDPLVRMAARAYVERAGFEAFDAERGDEALDCLSKSDQSLRHVLVTDIGLPDMTGIELAARARVLQPSVDVLYISAHNPNVLRARGVLPPQGRLLQKPFTFDELARALREILANMIASDRHPHGVG